MKIVRNQQKFPSSEKRQKVKFVEGGIPMVGVIIQIRKQKIRGFQNPIKIYKILTPDGRERERTQSAVEIRKGGRKK